MAEMPTKCHRCGKDPAEGYAASWTEATGTLRLCHGETRDNGRTCYESYVGLS